MYWLISMSSSAPEGMVDEHTLYCESHRRRRARKANGHPFLGIVYQHAILSILQTNGGQGLKAAVQPNLENVYLVARPLLHRPIEGVIPVEDVSL